MWAVEPGDRPLVTQVALRVGPGQMVTLRASERAARTKIHVSAPEPWKVAELTVQAVPELTIFAPVTAERLGTGLWQLPALPGARAHIVVSDRSGPVYAGRDVSVGAESVEFRVPALVPLKARIRAPDGRPIGGAQLELQTGSIQLLRDSIAAMQNRTPLWRRVGVSGADGIVEMPIPTIGKARQPDQAPRAATRGYRLRQLGARTFRVRAAGFRVAYRDVDLNKSPTGDDSTAGKPLEIGLRPINAGWRLEGKPEDAGRQVAVSYLRTGFFAGETLREFDELILRFGDDGTLNLGQVPMTRTLTQLLSVHKPTRSGHTPIATTSCHPLFNFEAASWSPSGGALVSIRLQAPDGTPLSGVEVRIAPGADSSFRGRDPLIGSADAAGRLRCLLDQRQYTVLVDDDHGYVSHEFEAKPGAQTLTLTRRDFATTKVTTGVGQKYSYSHWYDRNFLRFSEAQPDTDGELTLRYVPIYHLNETLKLRLTGPQPNLVRIRLFPSDEPTVEWGR